MAEDVGALKVTLGLDSAAFTQSMASVDRNLKSLGQELRGAQNKGKEWGSSLTGLTGKQDVLTRTLSTQSDKVNSLRAAYEQSKAETGENSKATENLAIQLNRAQSEMNRTETELNQVNAALKKQADELKLSQSNWTQLSEKMQAVGEKLKDVGDKMKSVGTGLSVGVTAPILAFGAAGIAAFNDVDEAIDTIITKTGATGDAAEGLTESFRTVAKRVPDDLLSVGEAIGEVNTQFGFLGKELEDSSQLMLQFANINGTDVTSASIASKQAIEAYGLANSDLNSVLDSVTKTAQDTGQAVDFLFDKATKGAPQIKALGLNFAEGTALIGSFEKAGVDSGAALSSMSKAQVIFAKGGKTLEEGLNGTIKSILGAKTETDALNIAAKVFGTKGGPRMVDAIKRGTFNLDEFTGAGEKAAGTVKNTFDETVDPIDQAAIAMNNAKLAMAEVGEVVQVALLPFMEKATEVLGKLADKFRGLSPEVKQSIMVVAGIAAAIGPVLVVVGTLVGALGTIFTALGTASAAIAVVTTGVASAVPGVSALAAVFTVLTGPIGIAIAAVAAIGVALVLAYKNVEWFREGVNSVWESVKAVTVVAFEAIRSAISTALSAVVSFVKGQLDKIKSFWEENGEMISKAASNVWGVISKVITTVMKVIEAIMKVVWPAIQIIIMAVWDNIKGVITGALNIIMGLVKTFSGLFTGNWKAMWDGIKQMFSGAVEALWNAVQLLLWGRMLKGIAAFAGTFRGAVTSFWGTVQSAFTTAINAIKNFFTGGFNAMKSVANTSMNTIKTTFTTVINTIKTTVTTGFGNVVTAIRTKMTEAVNLIKTKVTEMAGKVTGGVKDFVQGGKDLIKGLIKGIKEMAAATIAAITGVVDGIINKAKSLLKIASPSKVMIEFGKFIGQGLAIGITSTKAANEKAIEGVSKVITTAARTNAAEVTKIATDAEKARTAVQKEYASKRAELARNTAQSSQAALKTSKDKKGKIVTTGADKVHNIRKGASAKLIKLNEDEQKKLAAINNKASADRQKKETEVSKAKLDSLKTYVADKKSLDELSLVAEAAIWEKAIKMFKTGTKERIEAQQAYKKTLEAIDQEKLTNIKSFIENKKSLEQLSLVDEARIWEVSVKLFEDGTKEKIDAQKAYQAALKVVNDEIVKVNTEYENKMQSINDNMVKGIEEVSKAYEKALDDRTNSLTGFKGLFDEFTYAVEVSGNELLANLGSQVDGFKVWQEEIDKLSGKAIDDGLIAELREMGPKALPQLLALNSLTAEQLTQYSGLYQEKSKLARTQAEAELVGMKSDTAKRIEELRATANTELETLQVEWVLKIQSITKATDDELKSLKNIGVNAGQGLLNGLASMEPALVAKATAIANAVSAAMASALQVKSPSRVTMKIGRFVGEGLEVGMENSIASIRRAARMMANAAVPDVGSARMSGYSSQYGTDNGSGNIDNSKSFAPTVTIYTQDSGAKEMERTLRRMAFSF